MDEVVPLNHCPDDLFHCIRAFWALDHEDLYNRNYRLLTTAIAEAADTHNRSLTAGVDFDVILHVQSKRQRTPFAWVTINPSYLAPTTEEYESIFPQIAAQTIATARYQPLLKMKRSTVLDLELPDGRREFVPAFLALLTYWNKQAEPSE
ncbi:hypothetical protein IWQ61_009027 [Dispira simplex]|nr:hypothetical protein IWQ61_009027 [Dispira simplex]